MLTIDEDSEIVYANAAIEDILGYTPAELIGSPKMKIIPERLQPVHASALRAYVETGDRNIDWDGMELPALHKDGHEVLTLISLREHEHGGERYFTGIIRDVTERRRREECSATRKSASTNSPTSSHTTSGIRSRSRRDTRNWPRRNTTSRSCKPSPTRYTG